MERSTIRQHHELISQSGSATRGAENPSPEVSVVDLAMRELLPLRRLQGQRIQFAQNFKLHRRRSQQPQEKRIGGLGQRRVLTYTHRAETNPFPEISETTDRLRKF